MKQSAGLKVSFLASLALLGALYAANAVEQASKPAAAPPVEPPALQAPPQPPPRPADLTPPVAPPAATPSESAVTPLPPERPAELASPPANAPETPASVSPSQEGIANAPAPPERPPELSGSAALKLTVSPPDDTACLRRLERLGVKFGKVAPITNGQCSLATPIEVRALADGILLEPQDTMTCLVAEALARWTTEVQVAAQQQLGDNLKALKLGGAYHCRGQNHASNGKLSEHSFGNAVDIMGFTFEKRAPIVIQPRQAGTPEADFQRSVWTTACRFFRTVLGPGSNALHDNHLHFDERERNGGHRLCE